MTDEQTESKPSEDKWWKRPPKSREERERRLLARNKAVVNALMFFAAVDSLLMAGGPLLDPLYIAVMFGPLIVLIILEVTVQRGLKKIRDERQAEDDQWVAERLGDYQRQFDAGEITQQQYDARYLERVLLPAGTTIDEYERDEKWLLGEIRFYYRRKMTCETAAVEFREEADRHLPFTDKRQAFKTAAEIVDSILVKMDDPDIGFLILDHLTDRESKIFSTALIGNYKYGSVKVFLNRLKYYASANGLRPCELLARYPEDEVFVPLLEKNSPGELEKWIRARQKLGRGPVGKPREQEVAQVKEASQKQSEFQVQGMT